ncbi:MAG: hypothetical protein FWD73_14270 [Polyangiaceae bacterium]|nr:hypothetical protein [Polyangiaceae bacterium]
MSEGYRDEIEALRAREEALEKELAEAKALEEQLTRATPPSPQPPSSPKGAAMSPLEFIMALMLIVGVILAVIVGVTGMLSERRSRQSAQEPAPPVTAPAFRYYYANAVWHAHVKSADGVDLEPGSECRIESAPSYKSLQDDTATLLSGVKVTCGTLVLFTGDGAVQRNLTWGASKRRAPDAPDQYIMDIIYMYYMDVDTPSVTIITARGLASFTRERPQMRVELEITPGSDSVTLVPSP